MVALAGSALAGIGFNLLFVGTIQSRYGGAWSSALG